SITSAARETSRLTSSRMPIAERTGANPLVSFRDPAGCLVELDGRLIRLVRHAAAPDLEAFLSSPAGERFRAAGQVAAARPLDVAATASLLLRLGAELPFPTEEVALALEHDRVPFPS